MTKFILGYARTSTAEQVAGLEAQLRDLRAIGCEKIFSEQISSVAHREQLEAAIEFAREGDTLVVTSTCRLARSIRDLCNIVGCVPLLLARIVAPLFFWPFDGCFGCVDQDDVEHPLACSNRLAPRQPKGFALGQRVFAPFDVAVDGAFAEPIGLRDMKISAGFSPN